MTTTTTTLTTEIGNIRVQATDGAHVHACSGPLNQGPATINGVAYYVSMHLWKTQGMPGLVRPIFTTRGHDDIYLSRIGLKNPSTAARKKAWLVVTDAVNAWLTKNPTILIEARAAYVTSQVSIRNEQIAGLRTQIAALEAEITRLSDENYHEHFPATSEVRDV